MRKSLALIIVTVAMCGCQTALVYTGSVRAGDNQKAVAVGKTIEEEYVRQGLKIESDFPAPTGAYYSTAWIKPVGSTYSMTLWVGDWVKNGTLFIRIVPQPDCNDVSRDFGEHMRVFMTNRFPELEWNLVSRSELDWFR